MKSEQIIALQTKLKVVPDGFWGPKSLAAAQSHLRKLRLDSLKWPKPDQGALTEFYGKAGDESKLVRLVVSDLKGVVKYEGQEVKSITCHTRVAQSLKVVLTRLAETHPEVLGRYAGVYNNRPMRGGTTPSLHARGAAIDLWPERNGNHEHWPTAADMPFEVMEEFAREGWLCAGAFWSRDAMHFQATAWP
jgi:hypothetical protein